MRYARRSDLAPRVEMVPLIDVVFLLLTFFVFAQGVMVQAEVLPVELVPVGTDRSPEPGEVVAVTIDVAGGLHLDREPIGLAELDVALAAIAARDPTPTLFLAMEARSGDDRAVDRGPLLIDVIERVRRAGLTDFSLVGQP